MDRSDLDKRWNDLIKYADDTYKLSCSFLFGFVFVGLILLILLISIVITFSFNNGSS
jgi:steroid 5-alpha reductase family enzyme